MQEKPPLSALVKERLIGLTSVRAKIKLKTQEKQIKTCSSNPKYSKYFLLYYLILCPELQNYMRCYLKLINTLKKQNL